MRSDHLAVEISPSVPDRPKGTTMAFKDTREH